MFSPQIVFYLVLYIIFLAYTLTSRFEWTNKGRGWTSRTLCVVGAREGYENIIKKVFFGWAVIRSSELPFWLISTCQTVPTTQLPDYPTTRLHMHFLSNISAIWSVDKVIFSALHSKCICNTFLMLIKYCWHSVRIVNQSVGQSGSRSVQVAPANVATFIKVIELSREGFSKVFPLVTRIYLPVFTRNFLAIYWAICKLAENFRKFCFVFSTLTSYICIVLQTYIVVFGVKINSDSLAAWQLALNLQITCVYLSRPLLLMTARNLK